MDIWKCICFKKRNIKRDLHKVKSGASALESRSDYIGNGSLLVRVAETAPHQTKY